MTATNTDRYQTLFERLHQAQQGAFVPFITLGDPDVDTSLQIAKALIDGGADALELGFPFSDPIADGPVIQQANIRALNAKVSTQQCFELLVKIRAYQADIPIGLLLYSNLVMAYGLDKFYQTAQQSGVDSVLIADVPIREGERFRKTALEHQIQPIFIASPNSPDQTLRQVAKYSQGYTYLLSRSGVTGTDSAAQMPATTFIAKLTAYDAAPPLLGFGISTPQQVATAIRSGARGAISGSAVVKIIEKHRNDPQLMLDKLRQFSQDMKAATQIA